MKLKFTTTAANMNTSTLETVLSTYALKIESQWFPLVGFMPFFKGLAIGYNSGAATAATYNVWLNIPVRVQAVASDLAGASVVQHDELEGSSEVEFKNFSSITVPEFKAGKGYLIPFTAGAVVNIVPNVLSLEVGHLSGLSTVWDKNAIVCPNFVYNATKDEQVRTGTPFTGYIFDVVSAAVQKNTNESIKRTATRAQAFERVAM